MSPLTPAVDISALLGITLSDEQLAAVTAPLSSALVEAAAGSGKTTVMAARVVYLVATGQVRPDQVLGLTFTRKAAAELGRRIRTALTASGLAPDSFDPAADSRPPEAGEPVIATYDAFAADLVATYGPWQGQDPVTGLLDDASRFQLAAATVNAAVGPLAAISRWSPATLTQNLLELNDASRANLVSAAAIRDQSRRWLEALDQAPGYRGRPYRDVVRAQETVQERLELLALCQAYQSRKEAAGWVEFADQMAQAIALVEATPAVRADLGRRFAVVLLDEYQDTSPAQGRLLKQAFGPQGDDRGLPVMAVGDPRQAIYGWRGASATNLADFQRDFCPTETAAYRLSVNRRSDQAIIEAANELAGSLAVNTTTGLTIRAADEATPGLVETAGFESWPDEVAAIADRIGQLHQEGTDWRQIALLTRRNADLGPLWRALVERDVPVEIVGLGGLLSVPEISDLVAWLRLIDQPDDNPHLVQILTSPGWGLGQAELAQLGRRAVELARAKDERAAVTGVSGAAVEVAAVNVGEFATKSVGSDVSSSGQIGRSGTPAGTARVGNGQPTAASTPIDLRDGTADVSLASAVLDPGTSWAP
ncbi:MAG: ATP-dependent helicase, partial [Propionibacteriaceae bacterium]|nr:ATP-dependent helicase [Propionibacteriaceae bacterium]